MHAVNERDVKDGIYEQFARIGMAVASPGRIELLDLLAQGEKTVERLAAESGHEVRNTSAHLRTLRQARLVETRKEGRRVYYRLADEHVADFLLMLRSLAEARLAEVRETAREHFADRAGGIPLDRQALLERVRRGEAAVIDVRGEDEYRAGHMAGARSLPLPELQERLAELPRDQEIVAYCRGPYCFLALKAVALLRAHGYRAAHLRDGVADWRAAGLPVEMGEAA